MFIFMGICGLRSSCPASFFDRKSTENKAICKRDTVLNANQYDWMEWQAGYVSGSILMPLTHVRQIVSDYCQPLGLHGTVFQGSQHGLALIAQVVERFAVSEEAARDSVVEAQSVDCIRQAAISVYLRKTSNTRMCVFF